MRSKADKSRMMHKTCGNNHCAGQVANWKH